ncbi:MAG: alpha/beta hydrolase [Chloroflexota bacterium]
MLANTTTHTLALNGASLFYTQSNPDAPETILMIHAGICDHRMWNTQVAHFSDRYHTITLDMYGFGQSTTPTQAFAYHQDIMALLDHLSIEKTWIMACSLGGAITFDIALMHPECIKGLIMVAPAVAGYTYTNGDPHPLSVLIDEADDAGDLNRINELEIQMWVDGTERTSADIDPAVRDLVLDMNLIALKADDSFWEHEIEIDPPAFERLSEIALPTLLIGGTLDTPKSLHRLDALHSKIPHAQKIMFENTAHVPNMERPAQFNQHVDTFLAQHNT